PDAGGSTTCRPLPDTGQLVRTGHDRHVEFATAAKVAAAMVSAVRRTIAQAQLPDSSLSGGCTCSFASLLDVPSCTSAAPPDSLPCSANPPASTASWSAPSRGRSATSAALTLRARHDLLST